LLNIQLLSIPQLDGIQRNLKILDVRLKRLHNPNPNPNPNLKTNHNPDQNTNLNPTPI